MLENRGNQLESPIISALFRFLSLSILFICCVRIFVLQSIIQSAVYSVSERLAHSMLERSDSKNHRL